MDKTRVFSLLMAVIIGSLMISPAYAFIGAGVNLNNRLGDTININIGKNINALNTGFGLADMNIGVDWGVDYDISTLAGYPYGFGGIGAVTAADMGYNLGVTVDEAHGAGFNGAPFGVPLAEGSVSQTHLGQSISNRNKVLDTKVMLPFFSFPVIA